MNHELRRAKRIARLMANTTPENAQTLEQWREADGVISMASYLHNVIEEHIALRIARQKIGRRIGNQ